MIYVRWGLALALGGFLLAFGVMKFTGAHIFQFIEANAAASGLPGQGLFFPTLNAVTGVAEIVAGALLIIPATRFWGALLGTGVIGGAIVFHLSPYLGVSTPATFADTSDGQAPWILAADATATQPADFPPVDEYSAGLFVMACVFFVIAVANLALNRPRPAS